MSLFNRRTWFLSCFLVAFLFRPAGAFALPLTTINSSSSTDLVHIVQKMGEAQGISFERVSDDKDMFWRKMIEEDGIDVPVAVEGRVLASYAGHQNVFGYLTGDGLFQELLGTPDYHRLGQHFDPTRFNESDFTPLGINLPSGQWFELALRSTTTSGSILTWSSNPEANSDGLDHMVTWVNSQNRFHYIVGFEDLRGTNADRDFNDFVVELRYIYDGPTPVPTPEPGTLALLGLGLGGLVWLQRRKRLGS